MDEHKYENLELENLLRSLSNTKQWEVKHQLCTLRVCYKKITDIADTIDRNLPAYGTNPELNYYYNLLTLYTGKILREGEWRNIAAISPKTFKNLFAIRIMPGDLVRDACRNIRILNSEIERSYIYFERPFFNEHKKLEKYLNQGIDHLLRTYDKLVYEINEELRFKKITEITPCIFPDNTKWEDLMIEFKDGHNIEITSKGKKYRRNYKEMGFENSSALKPDFQWEYLRDMADNSGELHYKEEDKTKKYLLSKQLKECFPKIKGEPIIHIRKGNIYRSNISLIPEGGKPTYKTYLLNGGASGFSEFTEN